MDKLGQKLPAVKKSKLNKKGQKEENNINRRLTEANKELCDWRF